MSKTVLFQAIQFSKSKLFSSVGPIDRTLSGATTLGQCGPGSNGNERVLHIPQISKAGGLLSDNSIYPGHSLVVGVLPLCRDPVSVFYSPSQLGFIDGGRIIGFIPVPKGISAK